MRPSQSCTPHRFFFDLGHVYAHARLHHMYDAACMMRLRRHCGMYGTAGRMRVRGPRPLVCQRAGAALRRPLATLQKIRDLRTYSKAENDARDRPTKVEPRERKCVSRSAGESTRGWPRDRPEKRKDQKAETGLAARQELKTWHEGRGGVDLCRSDPSVLVVMQVTGENERSAHEGRCGSQRG